MFLYIKLNPLLESGGYFCPGEGGEGRLDLGQIFLLLVCQGQAGQETGQAVHHSLVLSEMKSELRRTNGDKRHNNGLNKALTTDKSRTVPYLLDGDPNLHRRFGSRFQIRLP